MYHGGMCGRYAYFYLVRDVTERWPVQWRTLDTIEVRYNVAPTMVAPVMLLGRDGSPGLAPLTWGLVPSWSDDRAIGAKMFNARSETIREKPAYKEAFAQRRCCVPISGFYEWETLKELRRKKPWFVAREGRPVTMLAGIWERTELDGERLDTFSIVTTEARGSMAEIHERSPVFLDDDDALRWMQSEPDDVIDLCRPREPEAVGLMFTPVSTRVGSIGNDDPSLVERVEHEAGDQLGLF